MRTDVAVTLSPTFSLQPAQYRGRRHLDALTGYAIPRSESSKMELDVFVRFWRNHALPWPLMLEAVGTFFKASSSQQAERDV
jgi:hypothetical protein